MRIIAGTNKGRVLRGPVAEGVRPTSDRLRETIFNIVRADVPGARVLDAFAGTGALGLEALSRGAEHVTFIERDSKALAILRQNIGICGAADMCTVIRDDVIGVTRRHPEVRGITLALLDPPYDFVDLDAVLAEAGAALAPGGKIVLEYSRRRLAPEQVGGLVCRRVVTAGDSALGFYAAVEVQ